MWWDPEGQAANSDKRGCYRAILGGKRFISASPPPGDPTAQKNSADPCSTFVGATLIGA